MLRQSRRPFRALCCALLALAFVSPSGAQEDPAPEADEEVEDVQDAEEVDIDEAEEPDCVEQPLGWLARHALVSHLSDAYPWITPPIVEDSLTVCEDDETSVQVSFEPHLRGPRWERSWTLACERAGALTWSCEFPEEQTFVYLSEDDSAVPIAPDVAPGEALEALAAIVLASREPSGIPDPFDASDPFLDLAVDSVLSVARDEICAGLFVLVQLDPEAPKNQFCVEREACGARKGPCPWTVRVEGETE